MLCVLQRVEDTVLKDTDELLLRGEEDGGGPTKVPARIREIITQNLSTEDLSNLGISSMSAPTVDSVRDENRMLQSELNRVEDLLSASRAERDEIGIKYNALSERVCHSILCIIFLAHS